jgi:hypothetical protein
MGRPQPSDAYLDRRRPSGLGDRVADGVLEHPLDEARSTRRGKVIGDVCLELQTPSLRLGPGEPQCLRHQGPHLDRRPPHRECPLLQLPGLQDRVDERIQPGRVPACHLQQTLVSRRESVGLPEEVERTRDTDDRSAQVVDHQVRELVPGLLEPCVLVLLLARDLGGQAPVGAREHRHRPGDRRERAHERRDRRRDVAVADVDSADTGRLQDRSRAENGSAAREGRRGDEVQQRLLA